VHTTHGASMVVPRRLWRVVGWVGILLDVASHVTLGVSPAQVLAPSQILGAALCLHFFGWPTLLGAHARLSVDVYRRTLTPGDVVVLRTLPIDCVRVSGSVGRL